MRIMVFDVPAESGGALSILNEFYNKYKDDLANDYIFVVSKPELEDTSNIKVLCFPWIKNSWFHRLFFDHFIAPKLVKKFKVNKVFSYHNIKIPYTKVPQSIYVHNALPIDENRFSIFENKLLWVYQNILSRGIFKSIKKANKVIVQTEWMKEACIERLKIDRNKIEVMPPKINIEVKRYFKPTKKSLSTFFYPASGIVFKNHKIIIEASIKLKEQSIKNYCVIFTLNGDENKHIAQLYKEVKEHELPVEFIGSLLREEVFDYYTRSILIFPSYIETVGLP
ncbi:MAG: glycosyltransferase, partial [Ignavibacteria bacterium]|nr:glycosyltransferase [Ignavibacteria bacterium]